MRWRSVITAALVAWGAAASLNAAAGEDAEAVVRSLFGDPLKEVASTRSRADDVALAARMLDAARAARDQPALLARLCRRACELAASDPAGYATALAAADLLADEVPDRAEACLEPVLHVREQQYRSSRGAGRVAAGEAYVKALLRAASARAEAAEHDQASALCRKASAVARAVRSPLVAEVRQRDEDLKHFRRVDGRIDILKDRLQRRPQDAEARNELVRLLAVDRDDPAAARRYLTEACDADLRKYVPAAAKPVRQAPELACPEMGDWYRGLAGEVHRSVKRSVLARARAYYDRFLVLHTAEDLKRKRIELMLRQVDAELEKLGGPPCARGRWIDLLRLVDLKRDQIWHTGWERVPRGIAVKARRKDDPDYGTTLRLPMVPEGSYEFEFACVTGSHGKVGLHAPVGDWKMYLWTWPDYVFSGKGGRSQVRLKNGGTVKAGRPWTFRIRVLRSGPESRIDFFQDGVHLHSWSGRRPEDCEKPDEPVGRRCPELIVRGADAVFLRARLRMLSGKARPLREAGS